MYIHLCIYIYLYVYMYIYIERERPIPHRNPNQLPAAPEQRSGGA